MEEPCTIALGRYIKEAFVESYLNKVVFQGLLSTYLNFTYRP